jgi:hypothetical protein
MEILEQILLSKTNRKQLIKEFQNQVWNKHIDVSESINNILSELAYDLDYYEPDDILRTQDNSYFGNDKLEQEIQIALKKIADL